MSKSLGNVIAPQDLVDRYGVDAARYFMMREVPFGNDGNFSHDAALNRINGDLANGLGNLAQRTLSMIHKNCEEKVPSFNELTGDDKALLKESHDTMLTSIRTALDTQQFHKAVEAIMAVCDAANAYIDHQAPWTLKKEDPARMGTVLYVLAETIRCLALAMQPFTPDSAAKMLDQLGIPTEQRNFSYLDAAHMLTPGTSIAKPEGIFPRLLEDEPQQAAGQGG